MSHPSLDTNTALRGFVRARLLGWLAWFSLSFTIYALTFPGVVRHYIGDACGSLPPIVRYFYEPLRLSGATQFGYYLDSRFFEQPQRGASFPP